MADEIQITPEGSTAGSSPRAPAPVAGAGRAAPPPPSAPVRPVEPGAGGEVPDYEDPEVARADIEATRARMSGTIDEIEDVLVRKKAAIQSRMDVLSPIKENPWPSMGIALGAGLLAGLLTGGGDHDHDHDDDGEDYRAALGYQGAAVGFDQRPSTTRSRYAHDPDSDWKDPESDWKRRAETLQERTERLLNIAREQEEEIESLRTGKGKSFRSRSARYDRDVDEMNGMDASRGRTTSDSSMFGDLANMLVDRVTVFVTDSIRQVFARR
ncbi:MAG: DUF3618 domain-containing protein [Gemmatimonadetes bacterium]|nr:DUF3618 domain-containing protein [Gemmatimonadota bacterium]